MMHFVSPFYVCTRNHRPWNYLLPTHDIHSDTAVSHNEEENKPKPIEKRSTNFYTNTKRTLSFHNNPRQR